MQIHLNSERTCGMVWCGAYGTGRARNILIIELVFITVYLAFLIVLILFHFGFAICNEPINLMEDDDKCPNTLGGPNRSRYCYKWIHIYILYVCDIDLCTFLKQSEDILYILIILDLMKEFEINVKTPQAIKKWGAKYISKLPMNELRHNPTNLWSNSRLGICSLHALVSYIYGICGAMMECYNVARLLKHWRNSSSWAIHIFVFLNNHLWITKNYLSKIN